MEKPIKITETILRDAQQSLIATRMSTEEMLPIIDKMDQVGYHAVECWGGATFDACLRFLKEDPWKDFENSVKVLNKQNYKCSFAGKISSDIVHMPMML